LNHPFQTRVRSRAQLLLCKGCCCGRPERGFPPVPVDRIKAIWKAEKLNRSVQLTISGCLGPCDLPNVVVLVTRSGTQWFGRLETDAAYDALIAWARACHEVGEIVPLPEMLEGLRLERFGPEPVAQELVQNQRPGC
jgi:(2Fe-2S) ferredoxin